MKAEQELKECSFFPTRITKNKDKQYLKNNETMKTMQNNNNNDLQFE